MKRLPDILVFLLLVVLVALGSYKIYHYIDVQLADDSHYLRLGLQLPKTFMPGYGPLYSLFFKIVHLITQDRWHTYFLAYSTLCAIPSLATYIFLR